MRITSDHPIRIFAKSETIEFLSKLKIGTELQAKVVARPNEKEALLDIRGRRIRAVFQRGVPVEDSLKLKLAGVRGKTFEFRLVKGNDQASILERLAGFSVLDISETNRDVINRLRLLSGKGIQGLFEFNLFLLRLQEKNGHRGRNSADIMKELLRLGVSRESLGSLSLIYASATPYSRVILPLLFLLGREKKQMTFTGNEKNDIEGSINKILNEVDNIVDGEKKSDIIRAVFDLLRNPYQSGKGYVTGEAAFFDGEQFNQLLYIGMNDSWLFRFFLTGLGELELLAMTAGGNKIISLFSDSNDSHSFLLNSTGILQERLTEVDPGIVFRLYRRQEALSAIEESLTELAKTTSVDLKA